MNTQSFLRSTYDRWVFVAAGLSATAGIIHAYYMPEHFEMWVGYGVFFLAVTICQVLLALVLLADRPVRREVLWAGIIGNAAIIVMWIVARTSGLPYGHDWRSGRDRRVRPDFQNCRTRSDYLPDHALANEGGLWRK